MAEDSLIASPASILLVLVALGCIFGIAGFWARRITRVVERVGAGYTELYKQQHREVMDALSAETQKALADTKALVMEHTELERLLKVLEQRADDNADAKDVLDDADRLRALRRTQR